MRKVRITVTETRVLQKDVDVTEEEYNELLGDCDDTPEMLKKLYEELLDSKRASTEYDYAVYDYKTDKNVVDFYD